VEPQQGSQPAVWLAGRLAGRPAAWLAGWLAAWLAGRLAGRAAGWLGPRRGTTMLWLSPKRK